jgi:hypothetical protein
MASHLEGPAACRRARLMIATSQLANSRVAVATTIPTVNAAKQQNNRRSLRTPRVLASPGTSLCSTRLPSQDPTVGPISDFGTALLLRFLSMIARARMRYASCTAPMRSFELRDRRSSVPPIWGFKFKLAREKKFSKSQRGNGEQSPESPGVPEDCPGLSAVPAPQHSVLNFPWRLS